jgi:SAM-dependent methyltransferase
MNEERPGEDGAIARAIDHGTAVPAAPVLSPALPSPVSTVDDEIAVEEGEPEGATDPMEPVPIDPVPSSRGRRVLRIPDDEVMRPISQSAPAWMEAPPVKRTTPPPFEASGGPPIAASRIITINPPPKMDGLAEFEMPRFSLPKQAPGIQEPAEPETPQGQNEDGWTPFHTTAPDVTVHDPEDADRENGFDEPTAAPAAPEPTASEILVDEDVDDTPSAAIPAEPVTAVALDSDPPPRSSEPGELAEVAPEDFVSIESPPLRSIARIVASAVPVAPPAVTKPQPGTPPLTPRPPPLLLVPGLASPLAPPPMNEASAAARRKARPWWEDLFNDDFIRTMAKVTDAQIATEVSFIEDSLGLAKGAVILDLACGTGRHAIEMTRRGYQVVGFDLSLAMLARAADEAQEREQKLNFVQGDMREMTFGETFDGVYAWNTSFGFFEEEKNSAVIANVHRALKPGGLLLLDVANRDFVVRQSPSLAWFEGDGCVCMDEMHVDWITSRMRVKRTVMLDDGRAKEIEYSIRIYALHELGKILHEQGFRVAEVSGRISTPGAFIGADSPRILVVAEKR